MSWDFRARSEFSTWRKMRSSSLCWRICSLIATAVPVTFCGRAPVLLGPDEMRSRDLMVCGWGEVDTKEPVCSPAEGRRNRRSICLALVVNVVDDLKCRKFLLLRDDGEREIRLDGL